MYAVEFETVSKDGVIQIPQEYKDKLDNREDIRLVVMYDDVPLSSKKNYLNITRNDELVELEQLFLASDNQIMATKSKVIDTTGMMNDIS